jgi:hypothetical protein
MAKLSQEARIRQAKEAKQKKFLLLLVPVFLGLVVWQGPKSYKALTGGAAPPPPPPVTTTTPVTTPTTPTTAPTGVGVSAAPGGSGLNETDPLVSPLEGQLVSFSRFESKDPFGGLEQAEETTTTTTPTDGGAVTGARAAVSVNGSSEDVAVGDEFPAGDPAFRLVSVTSRAAKIGLVSGSFSTGSETIEIAVGETLILIAETDGTRYVVRLESVAP